MFHIIEIHTTTTGFIVSDSMGLISESASDEEEAQAIANEMQFELSADTIKWR